MSVPRGGQTLSLVVLPWLTPSSPLEEASLERKEGRNWLASLNEFVCVCEREREKRL